MRKRTLAIYDESAADTVRTLFLLSQHPTFSCFDVFTFASPQALLSSTTRFDIALLEIGTQTPNGFDLAKALQSRPNCPAIVFVTNDPRFVYQGYEVAEGYLLKPLDQEILNRTLSRVARIMPRIQFSGTGSQGTHILRLEDINYIENWTFWHDIRILLLTPFRAVNRHEKYAKREAREAQKQNAGFGVSRKSDETENDDGEA